MNLVELIIVFCLFSCVVFTTTVVRDHTQNYVHQQKMLFVMRSSLEEARQLALHYQQTVVICPSNNCHQCAPGWDSRAILITRGQQRVRCARILQSSGYYWRYNRTRNVIRFQPKLGFNTDNGRLSLYHGTQCIAALMISRTARIREQRNHGTTHKAYSTGFARYK